MEEGCEEYGEMIVPVNLQISDDQTHLIYEFSDPINMDELVEAYKQERAFRDSIPHVIHSIVDMSQLKRIPANWLVAKAGPGFTHPRAGEIAFVGLSVSLQMIVSTISKLVGYKRLKVFGSRAEAEAYIKALVAKQPASSST